MRGPMALKRDVRRGDPGGDLIVLMHGRGADRSDLSGLVAHFPASATVVRPDAPFPGEPWGYGPGRAWYRYLGADRPEPASFRQSLEELDRLLDETDADVASGRTVLGGFSQGGTLALGYALSHPGRIAAVLNFSGFLPEHPDVEATPASVADTRFFWGHGEMDPAIPFAMARAGRAELAAAGADLRIGDYPIGHWIDGGELDDALTWLRESA